MCGIRITKFIDDGIRIESDILFERKENDQIRQKHYMMQKYFMKHWLIQTIFCFQHILKALDKNGIFFRPSLIYNEYHVPALTQHKIRLLQ